MSKHYQVKGAAGAPPQSQTQNNNSEGQASGAGQSKYRPKTAQPQGRDGQAQGQQSGKNERGGNQNRGGSSKGRGGRDNDQGKGRGGIDNNAGRGRGGSNQGGRGNRGGRQDNADRERNNGQQQQQKKQQNQQRPQTAQPQYQTKAVAQSAAPQCQPHSQAFYPQAQKPSHGEQAAQYGGAAARQDPYYDEYGAYYNEVYQGGAWQRYQYYDERYYDEYGGYYESQKQDPYYDVPYSQMEPLHQTRERNQGASHRQVVQAGSSNQGRQDHYQSRNQHSAAAPEETKGSSQAQRDERGGRNRGQNREGGDQNRGVDQNRDNNRGDKKGANERGDQNREGRGKQQNKRNQNEEQSRGQNQQQAAKKQQDRDNNQRNGRNNQSERQSTANQSQRQGGGRDKRLDQRQQQQQQQHSRKQKGEEDPYKAPEHDAHAPKDADMLGMRADDYQAEETAAATSCDDTTDPSEDYENYEEETEELFLQQMAKAQSAGGANAPAIKNQISQKHYAAGQKTESVKSPCNVVMVAEKPSIAQSITKALSGGKFSVRPGPARSCPIYVYSGFFKGHKATFKVTSVAGHVFNRDFPQNFQDWRLDPEVLFDAPTVRKLDKSSRPVANHLATVSRQMDFMVLWLDCDKEGENICYEVLDICKKNIPRSRLQRVYRAKFSSIADKDIRLAFNQLRSEPNFNESVSVDARQVLDLKIGVAFSRYQTTTLQKCLTGRDGKSSRGRGRGRGRGGRGGAPPRSGERIAITYGPCQTPTLGFCVDQAEKIKKFIPEPFWKIELTANGDGTQIKLKWHRGKIYDQTIVKAIKERMGNVTAAVVTDVKRQRTSKTRPLGINTVYLLQVASRSFGMSAQETLRIAEHLYLMGYTTYPRTESTDFSENFDFKEILREHTNHPEWGDFARNLLDNGHNRPKKGLDAGDHPPITPVASATRSDLGEREWKIYSFITRSFLGCISTDATYDACAIMFECGGEQFQAQGRVLIRPGFLEIMNWHSGEDTVIPDFQYGQEVEILSSRIVEGRTEAPGYLTEANLIAKMEKNGIGTDASIATHINNIMLRNYVQVRDPGRQLVPTPLGNALIKGYCQIDPELVLPRVRSNIERSCELISKGKVEFNRVVSHALTIFKDKFCFFKLSIGTLEKLITLMRLTQNPSANKDMFLSAKIPRHDDHHAVNFCIRCFQGQFCVQFHPKKSWGLKCNNEKCNFRIGILQGAGHVTTVADKCEECQTVKLNAMYKTDSPFPAGTLTRTGCILCDPVLKSTIVNFFFKSQRQKTPAELEEEQRLRDEKKKQRDEKKRLREEAEKANPDLAKAAAASQKKKGKKMAGCNILSAEDKMNAMMAKLLGGPAP